MYQRKSGDIARAHRFPVPLPDQLMTHRENAVMLRYDGKSIAGASIFFAVLPVADLAKLPGLGLNLSEQDIDGETAFFRETPQGVSLYLEADTHSDRLLGLREMARAGQVHLLDCLGDLRIMGAPDNLDAPQQAAYEENGFPEVDARTGIMLLRELSAEAEKARGCDEDPSISSGF